VSEAQPKSKNMAGPLLRGGEIALAACDAMEEDSPDEEILIEDHRTYLRVEAEGGLIIPRETMESILGRPFEMLELEVNLSGFSGQIEIDEHFMRWYLKQTL